MQKDLTMQLADAVSELHDLKEFMRSLNSFAFEEWYGKYLGERFVIFDGGGETVAEGVDAYEAWKDGGGVV